MKRFHLINSILFFIIAASIVVYFGSSFLVPFVFGVFLASLMTPFSNIVEGIIKNRIVSSLISTLVVFIVVGGLLFLLTYQMSRFARDMPVLLRKLAGLGNSIQEGIASWTGLSVEDQQNIIQDRTGELLSTLEAMVTNFLGNIFYTSINFLLTLIYLFLFLLYRHKFVVFFMMYVDKENRQEAEEVIGKTGKVVFHYLWGRIQVMTLLGVLYYITFLIFGLPYAVLLSVFGALITIIPYLGPFISTIFPIMFGILYIDDSFKLILLIALVLTIQMVESYVFEPLIIGKEVKLNPLVVIIAVILGGAAWGLAGMILFVPMFAIFKIISNHSTGLKPVGYLFGNTE